MDVFLQDDMTTLINKETLFRCKISYMDLHSVYTNLVRLYHSRILFFRDGQLWLPNSPGQPENAKGQPKWEISLPSGQLCFSGIKMEC